MYEDVDKFTINRKSWLHGQDSFAMLDKNKMCCLGFYAKACGLQDKEIKYALSPQSVKASWKTKLLVDGKNSSSCADIIFVNDSAYFKDEQRERLLKKKFKTLGIILEFI